MQLGLITIILAFIYSQLSNLHDTLKQYFYNYEPNPYDFKNKAFYKLRKKWDK